MAGQLEDYRSYSIKALHYIGNVGTSDRYRLGAPTMLRWQRGHEFDPHHQHQMKLNTRSLLEIPCYII